MTSPLPVSMIANYMNLQVSQTVKNRKEAIAASHQTQINDLRSQSAKWEKFKNEISDASSMLVSVRSRVQSMINMIDAMDRTLVQAGQSEDPSAYAASFNGYLKSLHNQATTNSLKPNVLGMKQGVAAEYPINIYGARATISGSYVGSDYYIDDTDGKRWMVDRSMDTIKRWESYPDTASSTGEAANLKDGLQLTSISGDTVDFVYGHNTATPQSFTGTLTREGLGLVDAWLYESLATEDGRARAAEDLESARAFLKSELSRYSTAHDVVAFHQSRIETVMTELSDKTVDLIGASQDAQAKVEADAQRQQAAIQALMSAQQTGYSELLTMLKGGKKTNGGPLQFNAASLFSIKA